MPDSSKSRRIRKIPKYQYTIQFVLKPKQITYSRKITANQGIRPILLVSQLFKNLKRQHPAMFNKYSEDQIKSWVFFYGYDGAVEAAEELDPNQSLLDLGIFPGSSIATGPLENF